MENKQLTRKEYTQKWREDNKEKVKAYQKVYNSLYRARKREWFEQIKRALQCCKCNEKRFYCLVFHHRDPNKKHMDICLMAKKCNKDLVIAETAKCDVLCANCHAEVHYLEKKNK